MAGGTGLARWCGKIRVEEDELAQLFDWCELLGRSGSGKDNHDGYKSEK
jgi:hypothetical protein